MRDDVKQALAQFEVKTFGNQKNIEQAERLLDANEHVLLAMPTNLIITTTNTRKKEKLPGVVFLTNRRFLFHYKVLFNSSTEIVPLEEIRAFNSSGNGITGGHVEIHTLTKTYDMLVSYNQSIMQKIQNTFESAKNSASLNNQGNVQQPDVFDQIEKLAALKEQGILSEEEFQQKKTELLSKL